MNGGGALAEEPPMPKLEIWKEKCLENLGFFQEVWTWFLGENRPLFIGIGGGRFYR